MRKSKTILQQLFGGEIYPSETINDAESQKISNDIAAQREYISGKLSESDKGRLSKMDDMYRELSDIYGDQCFASGFRLGALLLIEVFNKEIDDPDQISG